MNVPATILETATDTTVMAHTGLNAHIPSSLAVVESIIQMTVDTVIETVETEDTVITTDFTGPLEIDTNCTNETFVTAIDDLVVDIDRPINLDHSLPSARHQRSASTPVTSTTLTTVDQILAELRATIHPGLDLAITVQNILSRRVSEVEMRHILTAADELLQYVPNVPGLLDPVNKYFLTMWHFYRAEDRDMAELSADVFMSDMHILFWALCKLCGNPEVFYYLICKLFKCISVEEAFGMWLPGKHGFGRKYPR